MKRLITIARVGLATVLLAPAFLHAETITLCDSFPRQTIRDFTLTIPAFSQTSCVLENV